MVLLFDTTYISVDLAHQVIFHAKVSKGGIIDLIKQMQSILPLFATSVMHSMIQKQECLDLFYHVTLDLHWNPNFGLKNKIVLLCMQCCYGWHYITLQNM